MKVEIKHALVTVSIILVASLAVNSYLYYSLSQDSNLWKQNAEMQSQITALNSQVVSLQQENGNLTAIIQNLNKSSSDTYEPYLVTALGAKYTWSPNSNGDRVYYLYIQGNVTNEGNGTAYNCDLKIVTNSLKDSFTDYFRFSALAPGEHEDIDTHLYHVDLVNWTITPECTNTP